MTAPATMKLDQPAGLVKQLIAVLRPNVQSLSNRLQKQPWQLSLGISSINPPAKPS